MGEARRLRETDDLSVVEELVVKLCGRGGERSARIGDGEEEGDARNRGESRVQAWSASRRRAVNGERRSADSDGKERRIANVRGR